MSDDEVSVESGVMVLEDLDVPVVNRQCDLPCYGVNCLTPC